MISSALIHFRENLQEESGEATGKRGKAFASEKLEMIPLFSDTTCNRDRGTSTWEAMYDFLEEEKPRPLVTKATVDAHVSPNASYFEITCPFLHCIVARPKIIP